MSEDDKSVANGPQAQPRHDPRGRRHVPPIDATIPHGASPSGVAAPEVRPPTPHGEPTGNAAPSIEPVTDFPPVSEVAGAPPVELGLRDEEDLFAAVQREPRRSSEEVESARLEPVFGDFSATSASASAPAPEQPAEPEPRIELEPDYGPEPHPEPAPATFVEPQIFPSEPERTPEPSYAPEPRIQFEPEPVVAQAGGEESRPHQAEENPSHRPEEPLLEEPLSGQSRPEPRQSEQQQPSYPETPVFEEPTIQHADLREEPEFAGVAAAERPVPPRRRSRAGWIFVAAAMVLIALGTAWALNGGQLPPAGTETASSDPSAEATSVDAANAASADGLRAQIGDLEKRVATLEQRLGEQTPATPGNVSSEDQVKALDSRIGNLEDKANAAKAADAAPKAASTDADASAQAADAKPAIRNVTPDASVNPQAADNGIANKEGVDVSPASVQAATDALNGAASSDTASLEPEAPASLAPSSPVPPALPQPRPQFAARSLDNGNGFLQPPPSRATYDRPYDQPYGNRYPPPQQRQPNVVLRGWSVRDVYQGMALLQTSDGLGMIRVRPGDELPNGGGRITSIRRLPSGWAVMTTRGIITSDY